MSVAEDAEGVAAAGGAQREVLTAATTQRSPEAGAMAHEVWPAAPKLSLPRQYPRPPSHPSPSLSLPPRSLSLASPSPRIARFLSYRALKIRASNQSLKNSSDFLLSLLLISVAIHNCGSTTPQYFCGSLVPTICPNPHPPSVRGTAGSLACAQAVGGAVAGSRERCAGKHVPPLYPRRAVPHRSSMPAATSAAVASGAVAGSAVAGGGTARRNKRNAASGNVDRPGWLHAGEGGDGGNERRALRVLRTREAVGADKGLRPPHHRGYQHIRRYLVERDTAKSAGYTTPGMLTMRKPGTTRSGTAAVHGLPKPPALASAALTAACDSASVMVVGLHGMASAASALERLPSAASMSLKENEEDADVLAGGSEGRGVEGLMVLGAYEPHVIRPVFVHLPSLMTKDCIGCAGI